MTAQSSCFGPPAPEDRRFPPQGPTQRRAERAFVIQFDPVEGVRSRLRGRVELIASGEAVRFRSLKELLRFIVGTLRRRATAPPS